jgi:hypothetical protein
MGKCELLSTTHKSFDGVGDSGPPQWQNGLCAGAVAEAISVFKNASDFVGIRRGEVVCVARWLRGLFWSCDRFVVTDSESAIWERLIRKHRRAGVERKNRLIGDLNVVGVTGAKTENVRADGAVIGKPSLTQDSDKARTFFFTEESDQCATTERKKERTIIVNSFRFSEESGTNICGIYL